MVNNPPFLNVWDGFAALFDVYPLYLIVFIFTSPPIFGPRFESLRNFVASETKWRFFVDHDQITILNTNGTVLFLQLLKDNLGWTPSSWLNASHGVSQLFGHTFSLIYKSILTPS